ncbi:MAG: hypothetical protein SPI49_06135 [Eubacteriales bacterium]|nr:hypothetical protein [Eubacteriales bacterium]
MPSIQLKAMTRKLCHELYKHWTNDASIYMDMHLFQPYIYDEAAVNADTIRKKHSESVCAGEGRILLCRRR